MAKTQDYSKAMNDFMGAFPMDSAAMGDAFRNSAKLGEKMSRVALEAAEKSHEISSRWTRDTLAQMGAITSVKEEPAAYGKAMSDFASASAEIASENLAAYAEVAKKVQMETVELLMAAGKDASQDMTAAARKTGEDVTNAARKTTAASK
ncbi:Phasin [Brevirhabdus sp.]|uniref:Phasin n=1 Tax=Brevirhabdus sp. TaxID=2004514 RepID=UPI0040581329